MDIKEITDRNYEATKRRGLINNDTTTSDFLNKMKEELFELEDEIKYAWSIPKEDKQKVGIELADYLIVGFCFAKRYNIDIQKALEEKTVYNENRIG